ncbi:hypothetical protein BGX27_009194, partial [Mortierella sp. AM989]
MAINEITLIIKNIHIFFNYIHLHGVKPTENHINLKDLVAKARVHSAMALRTIENDKEFFNW